VTGERAQPAYAVHQFRDPAAEIVRLAQQAAIVASTEEEILRALGLPERGRALDVGCGPGFVAARMSRARPGLRIVGVDRDLGVLRKARTAVEVAGGTADRLPFPDASFDAAIARLLLRHLPDPAAALAEIHRVLRPGGRAIVIDTDDGALVMHPPSPAFVRALAAREATFRRAGADPFIGRRVPELFAAAGFVEPAFRPLVLDSTSLGLPAFVRVVLSPIADVIDADLLDGAGVESAVAALDAWASTPTAFGMTTVVAYGGTRR
jgi:ubiquinone/menaquinone biosynthesis C-methylase UbiE